MSAVRRGKTPAAVRKTESAPGVAQLRQFLDLVLDRDLDLRCAEMAMEILICAALHKQAMEQKKLTRRTVMKMKMKVTRRTG